MAKLKLWINKNNPLLLLTTFLFVFIPLYPKLPLADIIPGYLVRIRLEDFVVFFVSLIWFVQFLRRKIVWNTFFFWLIVANLLVGFASLFSGLFLNHTIPAQLLHFGKSALHLFRYAEYFSLFVIGFSAITAPKQLNTFFKLLLVVLTSITIYGVGQKYLQWPVYSTMNREYSKGEALTLGEHAKVQSTFGGHYDLAAFLVIVLPILFSYLLYTKKFYAKLLILAIELGGWGLLVLTGSKTSLLAAGLAHLVLVTLYLQKKGLWRRLNWRSGLKLGLASIFLIGLLSVTIYFANRDMALAFLNLANKVPVAGSLVSRFYQSNNTTIPQDWTNATPIYEEKKIVLENGETAIQLVEKKQDWSPNALKYGISMGIRLDTLWPNALTGLRRNPYLGASFGNLNKQALEEFTDSDSTDNNYLRTLGETGLLGFLTFYAIIALLLFTFVRANTAETNPTTVYAQALIAGIVGLAFNAFYIDVFSASKVAFIFWLLTGIVLKSFYLTNQDLAKRLDLQRFNQIKQLWNKRWPIILVTLLIGLLTWRNPYLDEMTLLNKFNFSGDNYQNLVLARCLIKYDTLSLCRPNSLAIGLPLNFSPAYALLIAPVYSIFSHPNAYYFVNFLLFNSSALIFYLILHRVIRQKWVQFIYLLLFIFNPFLREIVFKSTSTNLIIIATVLVIHFKLLLMPRFRRLYQIFLNHPATIFTVILGGIFFTGTALVKHPDPFLSSFALNEKSHAYETIKRANLTFTRQLKVQPYLITSLNPYFFDLYGNANYQQLPYSPQQDLYPNAKSVWGDFGFNYQTARTPEELSPLYESILKTNPLYFTNYGIGDFKVLRKHFGLKAVDLDCSDHCNIYQLSQKTQPKKLIEAKTYNNISLGSVFSNIEKSPKQLLSFSVIAHTYPDMSLPENQLSPGEKDPYTEIELAKRLIPLQKKDGDFLVLIGDPVKTFEQNYYSIFDLHFTKAIIKPLINVPNSNNSKNAQPVFQEFAIGDNYFLGVRFSEPNRLSKSEKIALLNTYYDLEFSDVDYLFIFSYQDLRKNEDFIKDIAPLYNELANKSIYIVVGNGGESTQSTDGNLPNHLGNITFLKTGFNKDLTATGLHFEINRAEGATVSSFNLE